MMYKYKEFTPKALQQPWDGWVAPTATVIGQVELGCEVSVWFGAVLRGDTETISVGKCSNIQDNAVIHADPGFPCVIGDACIIGHGAIVHGATLANNVLVGMHATIMNGASIGEFSIIGSGAVVPEGMQIPPHSLVMGVPAKIIKPITAEQFIQNLFGKLPEFFKNEEELKTIWSNPTTRKAFLNKLSDAGYGKDELVGLQQLIEAEKSDLFDVLEYVAFNIQPLTRVERVVKAKDNILLLSDKQQDFLNFVLSKYAETGVDELDQEKLPQLLLLKYQSISDAAQTLGGIENIRETFIDFQKYLYA